MGYVVSAMLVVVAIIHLLPVSGVVSGARLQVLFASVVPFLWLAKSVGEYNAQVARVLQADVVALLCLIVGVVAYALR